MTDNSQENQRIIKQLRATLAAAAVVIAIGAVFYHIIEKLSWLNAVYFCVITLATVGYGDITPKTDLGKVFTVFYVFLGVGIIATLANLLVRRAVVHREYKKRQ